MHLQLTGQRLGRGVGDGDVCGLWRVGPLRRLNPPVLLRPITHRPAVIPGQVKAEGLGRLGDQECGQWRLFGPGACHQRHVEIEGDTVARRIAGDQLGAQLDHPRNADQKGHACGKVVGRQVTGSHGQGFCQSWREDVAKPDASIAAGAICRPGKALQLLLNLQAGFVFTLDRSQQIAQGCRRDVGGLGQPDSLGL